MTIHLISQDTLLSKHTVFVLSISRVFIWYQINTKICSITHHYLPFTLCQMVSCDEIDVISAAMLFLKILHWLCDNVTSGA